MMKVNVLYDTHIFNSSVIFSIFLKGTQNSELRTFYLTNKQNNGDKLNDIN